MFIGIYRLFCPSDNAAYLFCIEENFNMDFRTTHIVSVLYAFPETSSCTFIDLQMSHYRLY